MKNTISKRNWLMLEIVAIGTLVNTEPATPEELATLKKLPKSVLAHCLVVNVRTDFAQDFMKHQWN